MPSQGQPSNRDIVRQWYERLDRIDYFTLLRLQRPANVQQWPSDADLRRGFQTFAASFHPDRFKDEDAETRTRATAIFRRANEALRVLSNPDLRVRYLRHLAQGKVRLEGDDLTRKPTIASMPPVRPDTAPMPPAPPSYSRLSATAPLASLVTHPAALDFAKQADALIARGESKKALFQAQLALNKEPTNEALAMRVESLRKSVGG